MNEQTALADKSKPKADRTWLRLFVVSLLSLFLELFVIRWLATEVRIFAYFKNIALMSAFLGLSLGFLWCNSKRDLFKWTPLILLYLSGVLVFALTLGITHMSFVTNADKVVMFGNFEEFAGIRILYVSAVLLSIYSASILLFLGLGQETGRLFQAFKPLTAYSINVAGGLVGILLFSYVSFLCTNPGVWLIIAGLLFACVGRKFFPVCIIAFGILYIVYLGPFVARAAFGPDYVTTVWSPYYRVDVRRSRIPIGPAKGQIIGQDVFINYDSFQTMVDDRPISLASFPKELANEIDEFHSKPFRCFGKAPNNVLIMGAGSGSDVAAALRANAKHIDAVEIDDSIYKIGKELHPEKPYDSPKVSIHIMDARTFLRNAKQKYDLIIFAFLDSHTAFSSLSSLRTDNYIFTKESMQEATKLLTDDGMICVSFTDKPDWLWQKHCIIEEEATGALPVGFWKKLELPSACLLSGPGTKGKSAKDYKLTFTPREASTSADIDASEDDWPFLFLPRRELPMTYVWPIFIILAVSVLPLFKELKFKAELKTNALMFCLGMGFMLLEVRAMSELSLLFGSTWLVNGVIIAVVMLFILLSNYIAAKLNARVTPLLTLILLALLVLSAFVKASALAEYGPVTGSIVGCLIFLVPLIFSSAIFSLTFKQTVSIPRALAFNLVGGMFGIGLEYLSMALGIRALTYVALVIYLTILILTLQANKATQAKATSA
ncbi:MAG: hypothetical protein KGS72_12775 [Cyanobacteria bacterium REEB67]|nr:hypothetical protein [Cyanobacteria bacterium REEB67]